MTDPLQPIETQYGGVLFRSRLEARWAVLFDKLRIKWQYEPEGYKLKSSWYVPDFWLPQVSMYAEVKPQWPSQSALNKALELAEASGFSVLILDGPPRCINYWAAEPYGEWSDYLIGEHDYWLTENRFYSSTGASAFNRQESAVPNSRWEAAVESAIKARFWDMDNREGGRYGR